MTMNINNNSSSFKLLTKKRFLWIFLVQSLGSFNDSLFKNAFIIYLTYKILTIAQQHLESDIFIGAALFILPFIFVSPFCGQIAAKFPKTRLIQYCKLFEIITASIAIIGFSTQCIPLLLSVLLLLGLQSSLFVTTKLGMVPEIGAKHEFLSMNGLFDLGLFVGSVMGTLTGGTLILTTKGPIIVSTIMLIISLVSYLAALRMPPLPAVQPKTPLHWNLIKRTKQLSQQAGSNKLSITAILGISWFWFFATIFIMQLPSFVKHFLSLNGDYATMYITLLTIGIAIGAALCDKLKQQTLEFRLTTVGAIGISLFTLLLATTHISLSTSIWNFFLTPYNWISLTSALLLGVFGGFYMVPLYSLIPHTAGKSATADIISFTNMVYSAFVVIAAIGCILLIQLGWHSRDLFLLVALLNIGFNLYLFIREPRFITSIFSNKKIRGLALSKQTESSNN